MDYKVIDSVCVNDEFRKLDLSDDCFEDNLRNSDLFMDLYRKVSGYNPDNPDTPTIDINDFALVNVYSASKSDPGQPVGGKYSWDAQALSVTPNGWAKTKSDSSVWVCQGLGKKLTQEVSWGAPARINVEGGNGTRGGVAACKVFKASLDLPATPVGGTYNFETKTIASTPSGWYKSKEEVNKGNKEYIWESTGIFLENGDVTWTVPTRSWDNQSVLDDGATNTVSFGVTIFTATTKDVTSVEKPRKATENDFDYNTKKLTNIPSGWALSPEEATTDDNLKIWQTSCNFLFDTKDEVKFNSVSDWSTPIQYLNIFDIINKAEIAGIEAATQQINLAIADINRVNLMLADFENMMDERNAAALRQLQEGLANVDRAVESAKAAANRAQGYLSDADDRLSGVIDDFEAEKAQLTDGVKVVIDGLSVLYEWVKYQGEQLPTEETLVPNDPTIHTLEDLNSKLTGKDYYNKFYYLNGELYKYITTSATLTTEIAALKADGDFLKTQVLQTESYISNMAEKLHTDENGIVEALRSEWTLTAEGITSTVDKKVEDLSNDLGEYKTLTSTWQQLADSILANVASEEYLGGIVTTKLSEELRTDDGVIDTILNQKVNKATGELDQRLTTMLHTAEGILDSVSHITGIIGEDGELMRQAITTAVHTLTDEVIQDHLTKALYGDPANEEDKGALGEISDAVHTLTSDGFVDLVTSLKSLLDENGKILTDLNKLDEFDASRLNDPDYIAEHKFLVTLNRAVNAMTKDYIDSSLSETKTSILGEIAAVDTKYAGTVTTLNGILTQVSNLHETVLDVSTLSDDAANAIAATLGISVDELRGKNQQYYTTKFNSSVLTLTDSLIESSVSTKMSEALSEDGKIQEIVLSAVSSITNEYIRQLVTQQIGNVAKSSAVEVFKDLVRLGVTESNLDADGKPKLDDNGNVIFNKKTELLINNDSISAVTDRFVVTGELLARALVANTFLLYRTGWTDTERLESNLTTSIDDKGNVRLAVGDHETRFNIDGTGQIAGNLIEWGYGIGTGNGADNFGLIVKGQINAYSGFIGLDVTHGWAINDSALTHEMGGRILALSTEKIALSNKNGGSNPDIWALRNDGSVTLANGLVNILADGSGIIGKQSSNKGYISWNTEGEISLYNLNTAMINNIPIEQYLSYNSETGTILGGWGETWEFYENGNGYAANHLIEFGSGSVTIGHKDKSYVRVDDVGFHLTESESNNSVDINNYYVKIVNHNSLGNEVNVGIYSDYLSINGGNGFASTLNSKFLSLGSDDHKLSLGFVDLTRPYISYWNNTNNGIVSANALFFTGKLNSHTSELMADNPDVLFVEYYP